MLTRLKNKVKNSGIFGKSRYGKTWQKRDNDWYSKLFNATPLFHENFMKFLEERKDVKTVLEIGCGSGIYPIKFKELFSGMKYVGIDISGSAISYCRSNSEFDYICGDILKMQLTERYDLIFCHSVIDHVYDIDLFLSKIIQMCKKYAYISSYRGYFPNLKKHKTKWDDNDGCYYNDLSVQQIKMNLLENGLEEEEFIIRSQETGQKGLEIGTVIEVNRRI